MINEEIFRIDILKLTEGKRWVYIHTHVLTDLEITLLRITSYRLGNAPSLSFKDIDIVSTRTHSRADRMHMIITTHSHYTIVYYV